MTTDPAAGAMPGRSDVTDSAPRTEAGRKMLAGFSGIAGYRPRRSRESVGIRDAILAIEVEAALPGPVSAEALAEARTEGHREGYMSRVQDESAAQPSADVVGALEKATEQLLIEHGHNEDSDADWPACRIVHPVLSEAHRALAAAREAGPPAAGEYASLYLDGGGDPSLAQIDAYLRTHFNARVVQPAAGEGWTAGGDFGVGIPGSKGYVPPRAAAEPADEGLRLLRNLVRAWDQHKGVAAAVNEARAYLATRRTSEVPRADS